MLTPRTYTCVQLHPSKTQLTLHLLHTSTAGTCFQNQYLCRFEVVSFRIRDVTPKLVFASPAITHVGNNTGVTMHQVILQSILFTVMFLHVVASVHWAPQPLHMHIVF